MDRYIRYFPSQDKTYNTAHLDAPGCIKNENTDLFFIECAELLNTHHFYLLVSTADGCILLKSLLPFFSTIY